MKKVLFALAICGLAFTSCNNTGKKAKKEEAHQHEGHDHEGHNHEGHHQEEFKVDADSSKTHDAHEGHDHEDGDHKH